MSCSRLQKQQSQHKASVCRSGAQAAAPPPDHKVLCDQDCVAQLGERESQTLKSGVKITDIRLGTGASPPVGLQVTVNYGEHCC